MDANFKAKLMGMMTPGGHRHEEMSQTLRCSNCGDSFKKAQALYNRMRKEKPELFKRKQPKYPDSPELMDMRQKLADRLKRDPMYKKHLELSFKGTPAERKRENDRANSGYYTRHGKYQAKKWL